MYVTFWLAGGLVEHEKIIFALLKSTHNPTSLPFASSWVGTD